VTAPIDTGPVVTSVSNINTIAGQTFVASNLFTASDPFGDAIEQYDFWDTGSGGGRFMLNGQATRYQPGQLRFGWTASADGLRERVRYGYALGARK
jgi:hypothetical protein